MRATLCSSGTLPEIVLETARDPSEPCVPAGAAGLGTRLAARQPSGSVGRTVPEDSVDNPASALAHYQLVFAFHERKGVRGAIDHFQRAVALDCELVRSCNSLSPLFVSDSWASQGRHSLALFPPEFTGPLRPIRFAGRQVAVAEVPTSHPCWKRLTVWSWPVLVYPEPWQRSRTSVHWHEVHGDITE